jgi:transposase InsO family protein
MNVPQGVVNVVFSLFYGNTEIRFCIDYVTKWVEAKALTKEIEQSMSDFLYEDIFVRFGVPQEIVIDQGTQFASHFIKNITQQLKIKHQMTTPYHPQLNGQVEVTNKVLEGILKKIIQQHHKDWVDHLLEALWALSNYLEEYYQIYSI